MRTSIDLEDDLIRRAMRMSGTKTKKAAVEERLRLLVRLHAQGEMRKLRGKVTWMDPDPA